MQKKIIITSLGLASLIALFAYNPLHSCVKASAGEVVSPNGRNMVDVGLDNGKPFYIIEVDGRRVIDSSYISLRFRDGMLGANSELLAKETSSCDEIWEQPWGEETTVRNNYNAVRYSFRETDSLGRRFDVEFRVFDDGVGFRYCIPAQSGVDSLVLLDENIQFNLAEDAVAWSIPYDTEYYEGIYKPSPVSVLDTVCTPLTMKVTDSLYLSIHEAALTDYASLNITHERGTCLRSYLTPWSTGEKVFAGDSLKSPWRMVIIGRNAGDLLLSRMMLNLNEPCALDDTSWIEPGRYIGIWWGMHRRENTWDMGPNHGATTENAKRYIDFAAANNYSGVLAEGWNKGWECDWINDGSCFDFLESYPDFDLEEVCRYAAEKGVRLIGHNETGGAAAHYETQLDSAFALYNRLGMNAVKTGYVNRLMDGRELHGSQYAVRHYRKVIETAARHHIMIDNHEPVMPTGLQRTYPNLMTQEGVRGQEYNAWCPEGGNPTEHTVILPFTRGLAGPMDYTPGVLKYNYEVVPGTRPMHTTAKELALAVVLYSPLQMSADIIENYADQPGMEFITSCPTNWRKTVVPEAKIGEYLAIARRDRKSDNWYMGAVTGVNARKMNIPLDFLESGARYTARIFCDAENADYRTNPYAMDIHELEVDSRSVLPLTLAPGGGAAVIFARKK